MGPIELVPGENGRQTLRVPKEILAAGEKVAALEAALSTVTVQVAALQAAASQPDRLSRTGAAFEEWMRGQAEASQALLKASADANAAALAQLGEAIKTLAAAFASKDMAPKVSNNFAPTIQPAEVRNVLTVNAQMPARPPRTATITAEDGSVSEITIKEGA